MSDTFQQIAFIVGLVLFGMLAGIFWHAHGGSIWLIPLLGFGVPFVVIVCVFAWGFFMTDWSH